mgnify:CR=1 FL=1
MVIQIRTRIKIQISKIKTREEAQDIFNDEVKFAKFVEKNKRFLVFIRN